MIDLVSGSPAWWDARYRGGEIPWDTGIVPPEVDALVSGGLLTPGWALDLGCGSGLSSRYLAYHGFRVVGIDLALSALERAHRAARAESLDASFCIGDVSNLGFLQIGATLALDIGCFHAIPPDRRPGYVTSLAGHLLPGAFYLLYAFEPLPERQEGPAGVGPRDVAGFAPHFVLRQAQHGQDRERRSAWYLLQRV